MNSDNTSATSVFRHAAHEGQNVRELPKVKQLRFAAYWLTANSRTASGETISRARWCVDSRTTRGAALFSYASCQRAAQRHQRSPGSRPGKSYSGMGGGKVVPSEFGELKEFGCHFHTNGVRTMILIIGVTTTVAKESRQRISATRLERIAQNIERFVGVYSCNHLMSST